MSSCPVPASVRVTVMFTRSGRLDGEDINLVVRVRVRPGWERWAWSPGHTGRYQVTAGVEYVEVAAVWRYENTSRFWQQQDRLTCGDSCWGEMVAPLTDNRTGDDLAQAVEWGVAGVVVLVTALYLDRVGIK